MKGRNVNWIGLDQNKVHFIFTRNQSKDGVVFNVSSYQNKIPIHHALPLLILVTTIYLFVRKAVQHLLSSENQLQDN